MTYICTIISLTRSVIRLSRRCDRASIDYANILRAIEDEIVYEGIIDYKIIEDESVDLIIGKVYEATLEEETLIQEATQTEIKKYTLVGLELRTT